MEYVAVKERVAAPVSKRDIERNAAAVAAGLSPTKPRVVFKTEDAAFRACERAAAVREKGA
jgi:hypothetical protein